jgi:hypothetical protein
VRRLCLVALALVLAASVRAEEDDDKLLETPKLDGIPERLEALEREWHEEVGTTDPAGPAEKPEVEETPEVAPPPEDPDHPEAAEVKPTPHEDEATPKKTSTVLESPLKDPITDHAASRVAPKDDKPAPAKPLTRDVTSPED